MRSWNHNVSILIYQSIQRLSKCQTGGSKLSAMEMIKSKHLLRNDSLVVIRLTTEPVCWIIDSSTNMFDMHRFIISFVGLFFNLHKLLLNSYS